MKNKKIDLCVIHVIWCPHQMRANAFLIGAHFLIVYRGLVSRGLAGSAIKRIADEAILSDFLLSSVGRIF